MVFFAVSAVLLIVFKVLFKVSPSREKNKKTNLDIIIGQKCVVIEEISNLHAKGTVKINGQLWSARSSDESTTIAEGKTVLIESIEGVKVICKEIE